MRTHLATRQITRETIVQKKLNFAKKRFITADLLEFITPIFLQKPHFNCHISGGWGGYSFPSLNNSFPLQNVNFIWVITWGHPRWKCSESFSGWGCSQLGIKYYDNNNIQSVDSVIGYYRYAPVDLYSRCQLKSLLQHNLSSWVGRCTQFPQVHGLSSCSTSMSPSFSSMFVLVPGTISTGSSRNGSRPWHSQGWSKITSNSSCIILLCKVWKQWNIQ